MMVGYMNLGTLYLQQDDTTNATYHLNKAVEISRYLPVNDKVISLYNIVAILYAVKGQNDKAFERFMNNLELSNNQKFVMSHIECLSYLGSYFVESGETEKALGYLREGLEVASKNKLPELKADILLSIAEIVSQTDPAKALVYLDEAMQIGEDMGNRVFITMVYGARIRCFKALGNFREALKATELKQKIADSIFSINKSIELSSIAATYELKQSNERVKDLEKESALNARQRNMMIVVVVAVALLLITLSVSYKRTINLNKQLKRHQAELNELNAMKDKLFSIIGHDLRGPMARIPTILDIYEDPGTDADEKAFLLQSLREHTKASMDMLEKLLFWGQALVKGIRIQMQRINLNEIVDQNVSLYAPAIVEKGVSVINKLPADIFAYADPTHVDFILRNLLTNAMKYSHSGGEITVSATPAQQQGFLVISVKDNGTGIKPEMLSRIFNPAYSVPGTADEKGTGIGLMLCKEFAILDGGDIWVESEYGKGATFFLSLKAAA
jgi:signal transduction histidine kinase